MRELVDEQHTRAPGERAVEVELGENGVAVFELPGRKPLESLEQGLGVLAAVRLDPADDDIDAPAPQLVRRLQHGEGLADAGHGAEEELQPAALLRAFLDLPAFEQAFRRGPAVVHGHYCPVFLAAPESASSARFNCRTLTRRSPRKPSCRGSVADATRSRTVCGDMARAAATRSIW